MLLPVLIPTGATQMSFEHKQHCPPRVKCPVVGEKGSWITYASSKSLREKFIAMSSWSLLSVPKNYVLTQNKRSYITDLEKGGLFPKYS